MAYLQMRSHWSWSGSTWQRNRGERGSLEVIGRRSRGAPACSVIFCMWPNSEFSGDLTWARHCATFGLDDVVARALAAHAKKDQTQGCVRSWLTYRLQSFPKPLDVVLGHDRTRLQRVQWCGLFLTYAFDLGGEVRLVCGGTMFARVSHWWQWLNWNG